MSCVPVATFRLLDARVGWDPASPPTGLVGLESDCGIELVPLDPSEDSAATVLPYLYPRRLARGPGPCEWVLASRCAPVLLRLYNCAPAESCPPTQAQFEPWGPQLIRPAAVGSACGLVAASDWAAGEVVLIDSIGQVRGRVSVALPLAVTLAPWGELWVAALDGRLLRFGLEGASRGEIAHGLGRPVATRAEGRFFWLAHEKAGRLHLACFDPDGAPVPHPLRRLRRLKPTGIARWSGAGFCWADEPGPVADCVDWCGRPATRSVGQLGHRALQPTGELVCGPLQSADARTVWHRVRLDATVPPGTGVAVAYATLDTPALAPAQWHTGPAGQTDFLVQAPPGRYLALRLTLTGDGRSTPRVRQVRVDFPRVTSAELLPDVYFEEPRSADFTERFVSLFDAELEALDRAIETFPRWLEVRSTPESALAWLGGLLGLSFDSQLTPEQRALLIAQAPSLFAERGTPRGLKRVLEIVTGVQAAVVERRDALGALPLPGTPLGTDARLSSVRLFSASGARFRTGRSALGQARVRSFGNPDVDPWQQSAYRLDVSFPAGVAPTATDRERLDALVKALAPAHLLVAVHFGGEGGWSAGLARVGIDTALTPFPAPALGINSRLSRQTVLWPSPSRRCTGLSRTPFAQGAI